MPSYGCQELRWVFIGIGNRNDFYSQYPVYHGSDGISWYSQIYQSVSLWFPMGIAIPPNTLNYHEILYGNQPLHNEHNFSRELIGPYSFVRGLGGRQSRFNLNDDVSAPITFASSVDAISSSNECFACDISGFREAVESSGV